MSAKKKIGRGCLACAVMENPPKGATLGDAFARGFGANAFIMVAPRFGKNAFCDFVEEMCVRHRDSVATVIAESALGYDFDPSEMAAVLGMVIREKETNEH